MMRVSRPRIVILLILVASQEVYCDGTAFGEVDQVPYGQDDSLLTETWTISADNPVSLWFPVYDTESDSDFDVMTINHAGGFSVIIDGSSSGGKSVQDTYTCGNSLLSNLMPPVTITFSHGSDSLGDSFTSFNGKFWNGWIAVWSDTTLYNYDSCGDGILQGPEQCDDGNNVDHDGCSSCCRNETCGDGIQQPWEVCDDGNDLNNDACTDACVAAAINVCGNAILETGVGEECDDGNAVDGDGCSSSCSLVSTTCGNGVLDADEEECDDGNLNECDGCTPQCKWSTQCTFVKNACPLVGILTAFSGLIDQTPYWSAGDSSLCRAWLIVAPSAEFTNLSLGFNSFLTESFDIFDTVTIYNGFAAPDTISSLEVVFTGNGNAGAGWTDAIADPVEGFVTVVFDLVDNIENDFAGWDLSWQWSYDCTSCDPVRTDCTANGCVCKEGFEGADCDNINECIESENTCMDLLGICHDSVGSFSCSCVPGYTNSSDGNPNPVPGSPVNETFCFDVDECSYLEHGCDADATCENSPGAYLCSCNQGFVGDGFECRQICDENQANSCHELAYCEDATCTCPEGIYGDGIGETGCTKSAWTVRFSIRLGKLFNPAQIVDGKLTSWTTQRQEYISLFPTPTPPGFSTSLHHEITYDSEGPVLTLNAIYSSQPSAEAARLHLQQQLSPARRTFPAVFGILLDDSAYQTDPRVYRWAAKTSDAELQILATGMDVERVYFQPSCLQSGCWVVDIIYTLGEKNFNVFYLPHAVGNDELSFDFDYGVPMSLNWAATAADTFSASSFPCSSADYVPGRFTPPTKVTACCIPQFIDTYRPLKKFVDNFDPAIRTACAEGGSPRFMPRAPYPKYPGVTYFTKPEDVIDGTFKGMTHSNLTFTGVVDPYIRQFTGTLYLDEVELRQNAGMLRGTVGVEHTVDTFIGLANFKPTGLPFVDPNGMQVALHLEKTNFFSVSTHGTNQYTFLEYVNMRLVVVYAEDDDFSGEVVAMETNDDEASNRTVRTSSEGNAAYVQVTFTLGPEYSVNNNPNSDRYTSGLIPLDSVRVGRGTFLDDVETAGGMQHTCSDYYPAASDTLIGLDMDGFGTGRVAKKTFDDLLGQTCGPQSAMCASPSSVPDSFVSFNIPLGTETFDDAAAADLSSNIFVSMVVNALDEEGAGSPGGSDAPDQMKTTLTASIPIVAGGINIFCDGVIAKTDLKDVANADIVVGTARSALELTRLRILENIASTDLAEVESQEINTASIESALMTLVLKGDDDYFRDVNTNTHDYTLELDSLITLHLMEDGGAGSMDANDQSTNSKETEVLRLLGLPGADNSDTTGLDTSGYALNGAFEFWIERTSNQAHLEPTEALLAVCPFNPAAPSSSSFEIESCITRRDVKDRGYPARLGSAATAIEILAASRIDSDNLAPGVQPTLPKDSTEGAVTGTSLSTSSPESDFMATVLGDDDFSRGLAVAFAETIRDEYDLNGRYRRAYWINPGYEWTPTQTAGASLFSVSQKVYLFALVSLDEHWQRRRMLLQSSAPSGPEDNSAGVNAASLSFGVTPKELMASAFNVPEDRAAIFTVTLELTEAEACMSPAARQDAIRETFVDYLSQTASALHTVQVTKMSVDIGSVQCPAPTRRGARQLFSAFSDATATVEMLLVFKTGTTSIFNPAAFANLPGVKNVQPAANNSPKIELNDQYKCTGSACGEEDPAASESGSKVALIAGVAGGVGGALAVGVAVMLYLRKQTPDVDTAVQSINVADLKSQLAAEV